MIQLVLTLLGALINEAPALINDVKAFTAQKEAEISSGLIQQDAALVARMKAEALAALKAQA